MNQPKDVYEVINYLKEQKIKEPEKSADAFYWYYESVGWMRGKNKIVNWKACVRTWLIKGSFIKIKEVDSVVDKYAKISEEISDEQRQRNLVALAKLRTQLKDRIL